MSNLGSSLGVINFEKFGEAKGKVFTADNFAKDWDSIYVIPSELSDGVVNDRTFHKEKQTNQPKIMCLQSLLLTCKSSRK